jgi:hypothetical protein
VTAPRAQIIAIDAPTLAEGVPLRFDCWDPGEDSSVRPALADGWRSFVAQLATAIHAGQPLADRGPGTEAPGPRRPSPESPPYRDRQKHHPTP